MSFCIKHAGPDLWTVDQWIEKRGWLRKSGEWKQIGAFRTEAEALDLVRRNAAFEPHTSFYDKHGNMQIESTDW